MIVKCDCGKSLRVSKEHIGKKVRCPSCNNTFDLVAPVGPLDALEVELIERPQPKPSPLPIESSSEISPERRRESHPVETKLYLQVAAALAGLVLLLIVSYTATNVFAALGVLVGLVGCLLQLIRKRPWKPLLALAGGCVVIMGVSVLMEQGEKSAQQQAADQKVLLINQERYDNGIAALQSGSYGQAIVLFSNLGEFKDAEEKLKEARTARWDRLHAGALATLANLEEEMDASPGTAKKEAEGILNDYYNQLEKHGDYSDVEDRAKSVIASDEMKVKNAQRAQWDEIHAGALVRLARLEEEVATSPGTAKKEAEEILKEYYNLLDKNGDYGDVENRAKSVITTAGLVEIKQETEAVEAAENMAASGKLGEAEASLRKLKAIYPENARIQENLKTIELRRYELMNDELYTRAASALANGRETEALQTLRLVGKDYSHYGKVEAEINALVETEVSSAIADIETRSRTNEWELASEALSRLRNAKPDHPRIQELEASLQKGLKAHHAEALRIKVVAEGIAHAERIVNDTGLCDTPLELKNCWGKLKQVKKGDKVYRKARRLAHKLERCRQKTKKALDRGLREVMVTQRKDYTNTLDKAFLDIGMDVKFRIRGKYNDQLTLTNVLFDRVWMQYNEEFVQILFKGCKKVGFKRVVLSNGFGMSHSSDLKPQSEANGGQTVLDGLDIGRPFKL